MINSPLHFALIGWPLSHSLSPVLHRAALAESGLPGDYQLLPIPTGDPEALRSVVHGPQSLASGNLHGLNVTIPHKETILAFVDEATPLAAAVGAVNCLYLKDGRVTGDNTDAPAFLSDIQRLFPGLFTQGITARSAVILGAGGAARAATYSLMNAGWQVWICARRLAQAEQLIASFAGKCPDAQLHAVPFDPPHLARLAAGEISLLINATPLGLPPQAHRSPWPEEIPFPKNAAVYDLLYNPAQTAFIKAARRDGLPTECGAGMLVEQAALSFERWTSLPAPRQAMRLALQMELDL